MVLYDFCDTLFKGNTTRRFCSFVCRKRGILYSLRYIILRGVAFFGRRIQQVDDLQYMRLIIFSLHGLSEEKLTLNAKEFMNELLHEPTLPAFEKLKRDLDAGCYVVIISFTLQLILDAFKSQFSDVQAYGNRLTFDVVGNCTGKYGDMIQFIGKRAFLLNKYPADELKSATFYTDDKEADADLLDYVKNPHLIPVRTQPKQSIYGRLACIETLPIEQE